MVGTIELDRDGHNLVIRFPYREDLVDEIRALPGRRWDRSQKVWRVPTTHAERVVSTFMRHGFVVTADVTSVLAGTRPHRGGGNGAAARAEPVADQPATAEPLTISQLNALVQGALQRAFPATVRVIGEVSDFDKSKDRRHVFFTLVEKDASGQKSRVEVALFARTAERLLPALHEQGLTLRDGVEILVEARVDLYPQSGRYQLILEDVRPEFTLGKLALTREQILRELRERKLERVQLERPLPRPVLRIGCLASPDSDGWNDFLEEIEASGVGFAITLVPIRVQGAALKPTLLRGLSWFQSRALDFDVLCIVRGGGSRTDLAWFDDLDVAVAVAQHPVKILCGIGHHRDQSVLDRIAHSEKTPTAAAARLVAAWREADAALTTAARRLRDGARAAFAASGRQLTGRAQLLLRILHGRLAGERRALTAAGRRLDRGATARSRAARERLSSAPPRITRIAGQRIGHERRRLEHCAARRRLLDPIGVLQRGYAVLRDADSGRIVTSVARLRVGQAADIVLRDGRARGRIESVENESLEPQDEPGGRNPAGQEHIDGDA